MTLVSDGRVDIDIEEIESIFDGRENALEELGISYSALWKRCRYGWSRIQLDSLVGACVRTGRLTVYANRYKWVTEIK